MKIKSEKFENNGSIPALYTCDGESTNPPLEITQVPNNAKSLALIVDDPDAPGGDWVHWLLWNIDPKISEIEENSIPDGATEGKTTSGGVSYTGPCPPAGTHRYLFKAYALDTMLDLPTSSSKSDLLRAMEGHVLDQDILIGQYGRR